MKTDDALLDDIIREGRIDLDNWPGLLSHLLGRIDEIVRNAFPLPQSATMPTVTNSEMTTSSQTSAITNNISTERSVTGEPTQSDLSASVITGEPANTVPSEEMLLLSSLKETLTTSFSTSPPHTVQRLAELLRNPNQHYHNLSKYLRALQRVLSVSSTVDQFPLPLPVDMPSGILGISSLNNVPLGSDESLGGALLTPISWLKSEGEAGIPNGIYRDEASRLEQEMNNTPAATSSNESNAEDTPPQAQGPPTIGPEDLGPQPAGLIFPDITDAPSPGKQSDEIPSDQTEAQGREGEDGGGDTAMSNSGEGTTEAVVDESSLKNEDNMDVDPKGDVDSSSKDLPTREAPEATS